jgi:hypothetical protein
MEIWQPIPPGTFWDTPGFYGTPLPLKSCLTVKEEGRRFRTIKAQTHLFLTLDIKDPYINLPTRENINFTKYLLTNRGIPHNRTK